MYRHSGALGGKGTHIAVDLIQLGLTSRTFGVSFGERGKEVIAILEAAGIKTHYLWYGGRETRTNYIFIDQDKNCTMFTERGEQLSAEVVDALIRLAKQHIQKDDVLVISGDASNVDGKDTMQRFMQVARDCDSRIFIDSSGKFLKEAIAFKPFLIKPNVEELSETGGRRAYHAA